MSFRIDHEFLMIGKPSTGFSKNYFYEWDDGLGGARAQLFLNFFTASDDVNGDQVGSSIFDVMKNYFFHDLSRSAADRFEDTLKEINAEVRRHEEESGTSIIPQLHVIGAAISGNVLYLSQHGDSEAYLVRRRYVSPISEDLSDPKNQHELFQNIANGELAVGDSVLLCSTRLLRYITKPDLGRLLSGGTALPVALDAINDAVSVDLIDRMSIVGVQVGEAEPSFIVGEAMDAEESTEEVVTREGRLMVLSRSLKLTLGKLVPTKKGRTKDAENDSVQDLEVEASSLDESDNYLDDAVVDDESEDREAEEIPASDKKPMSEEFIQVMQEWKELKRDKILILLVVVVLVLMVGIYVVRHQGRKQNYIEKLEGQLATVELNVNTARTTGAYDKETAALLLDEAESLSLEVLNSGYLRGKASEYLTEIETQRDRLDGVQRIESPEVFADFSLTNPTMNARGIVAVGDNVYVFEADKLYEILLDQIQEPVVIDANEVAIDAAYFDDRESLFFLTKSGRILEYKDGQFSFMDTSDGSWRGGVDIEIYNNRVYLLDSTAGQIWRYSQQRNGFGGAEAYVTDGSNLKGAASLSIDGAVYALNDDGSITKFASGEKVTDFTIRKAPTADLSGATVLNTEFEMFQVFVLDPAGSRVLVYNKDVRTGDLVYASQYILDNVEELRDLYVDKDASRLYILGKSKVYRIQY